MKKRSLKILITTVLVLLILMPYLEVSASTLTYLGPKVLGALGDRAIFNRTEFVGGVERTGTVPADDGLYDDAGYALYRTPISIDPPVGPPTHSTIAIRNIAEESSSGFDSNGLLYCLDPTQEFPPTSTGTENYTSVGLLSQMTDIQLRTYVTNQGATVRDLRHLLSNFYYLEGHVESNTYVKSAKLYKDRLLRSVSDNFMSPLAYTYQTVTDDDIKVAQQWALWKEVSYADWGEDPTVERDLDDDGDDDTPGGMIRINRDSKLFGLSKNISNDLEEGTLGALPIINLMLNSNFSRFDFVDSGSVSRQDYGPFRINTEESNLTANEIAELITDMRIFDKNGVDITTSGGYQIFIGEAGSSTGTTLVGSLQDNMNNPALLDSNFVLRYPSTTTIVPATMEIDYIQDREVDGEIFVADNPSYQNVIKIGVRPVSETIASEFQSSDLALRKFITEINGEPVDSREPVVTQIDAGVRKITQTTAHYAHKKNPLVVEHGDTVTYEIRVYNEAVEDGYFNRIRDILPAGLSLKTGTGINEYWDVDEVLPDGRTVIIYDRGMTRVLNGAEEENGIYNKLNFTTEIKVDILVDNDAPTGIELTNIAFLDAPGENDIDSLMGHISKDGNNNLLSITNAQLPSYRGHGNGSVTLDRPGWYFKGYEDEDDFEKVIIIDRPFDLALRKFITAVNDDGNPNTSGDAVTGREPIVDFTGLVNGTATTATYSHPKNPVMVQKGDLVRYTIRVYNEGAISGYAQEIRDILPKGLGYLPQHRVNIENEWEVEEGTSSTVLDYPSLNIKLRLEDLDGIDDEEDLVNTIVIADSPILLTRLRAMDPSDPEANLIKKFLPPEVPGTYVLDYVDVEIVAVVLEDRELDEDGEYIGNLRNWAEVAEDADENGDDVTDRDSVPGNLDEHPDGPYEDDEDYEDLTTRPMIFDLALQKFISQIDSTAAARNKTPEELEDRRPVPHIDSEGKITYVKENEEPPLVGYKDVVTYTIRVYNEGDIDGFAKKVRDTIPEGLTYLPNNATNLKYQWYFIDEDGNIVTDIEDAKFIETEYLSRDAALAREANNVDPNVANTIIKAFDKENKIISFRDLQIVFEVNEKATPGANNLKNIAEISEDEDPEGNPIDDEDSIPGNENPIEDDIDDENLIVTYFDLALLKIVTNVELTENGKVRDIPTGHTFDMIPEPVVKTDLDERYLDKTQIKYTYKIRITNEGLVEGYATEVSDYIPEGLEFYEEDQKNNTWFKVEGKVRTVATTDLAGVLLKPGESATIEIVLRWINHRNNMGVKTNVAEISKDHNEYELPDIDSVPGNEVPGEDDIDDASVMVAIRTGAAQTFFVSSLTMAIIVGLGAVLIKKYVV